MSNILDKTEFNQDDILEIITSRLEESINIEFKDARALSSENGKEISKDVSAFANSDGGIIFYGINEENHVATSPSFIDGNKYNKEWLENKITTNIQQAINNLLIIPVRFDNDISKTVYIVKIPKSRNSPHINGDKKYYRRYNFKSVPMEEYEVRDSYFRMNGSSVYVDKTVISLEETRYEGYYKFIFHIQAANSGNFIAEKYRIACNIKDFGLAEISSPNTYIATHKLEEGYKISTNEVPPIFPNEVLKILNFSIEVSNRNYYDFIENVKFDFYTYNLGSFESEPQHGLTNIMKELVEKHNAKTKSE
ncbi:ATP-binding protein [uncultured Flavobacterium sp.]|uniref:AlbA family DNA-binding domain-containing protein n=1 Tax=uncultured Flavobacterium sp. TaxID=165435 RepID=UPI0025DBD26A|nr:ATP-binding protein [uncultured Flavobacterium sp.]